jgi:lipopolysaccharide/colanic/teichoic acid biosynthesis glycosyltransferase
MITKRVFDLLASAVGLVFLLPVLLLLAAAVRVSSTGPILFRQQRVGYRGRLFNICKFRTMYSEDNRGGLQITIGADQRITPIGRFLRHYKLDELPQLWNVLVGDMSIVGPRPEVPKYVRFYPPSIREQVLSVRPGITDRASIEFRDEAQLLSKPVDPERVYIEQILPIKLAYYSDYVTKRSFIGDLRIIVSTILAILR